MKNKSTALPLLALVAVFLLASGTLAGSVIRTLSSSYKSVAEQVPSGSQLAHVGGGYVWGDIKGWSWSSNIGWISFNGNDAGANGGDHHVYMTATTTASKVGAFRGYAWSPNVGWISFEPADITGCPVDGTYDIPRSQGGRGAEFPAHINEKCTPRVDTISGQVTGWARVLSMKNTTSPNLGGWLQLSGTNHESQGGGGLTYDPNSKSFSGYVWEPDALGWVSVNVKLGDPDVAVAAPLSATCSSSAGSSSILPGSSVTFSANVNGGNPGEYQYKWGGAAYSNQSNTTGIFNVSTSPGTTLIVKDADEQTPVISCPDVTVAAAASINFYIGRDSATTKTSHSVRKGNKFAVSWINNLPTSYTDCGVEISNNGDTYWSAPINTGIAISTTTGGITNLETNISPKGTYTFDFICQNAAGTLIQHAAPATLRIIGVNDQEE